MNLDGLYTDVVTASPFWVGAALVYIVLGIATCIIIFRWGLGRKREARMADLERRVKAQEDITKPLADLKAFRMLNEEKNGHDDKTKAA